MLGPGRYYIAKRARAENLAAIEAGEWDPAFDRAVAPLRKELGELQELVKAEELQAQVTQVQARLEELDQALEARLQEISIEPVQEKLEALDEALGAHLQAIQENMESLPGRVRSSLAGSQGAEIKGIQKAAEAAEMDAVELYEADMDPQERLIARIDAMSPSAKWQQDHQIGAEIVRGVKDMVIEQLRARRGNVVTMKRVGSGEGNFPTVYGGR